MAIEPHLGVHGAVVGVQCSVRVAIADIEALNKARSQVSKLLEGRELSSGQVDRCFNAQTHCKATIGTA